MYTILKNGSFTSRGKEGFRAFLFSFLCTLLALPASAGFVLPDEPLVTGARIPPNVLFVLDNSGSMADSYMPDSIANVTGINVKNETYVRNVIYYDPHKDYLPWVDSTGATMTGGTTYSSAYSHNDLVPPFSSDTTNLYEATRSFYVPKDPTSTASFGDVANYWRYQILTTGTVQRSEWDGSRAAALVPSGYPQTGTAATGNTTMLVLPVVALPQNAVNMVVEAVGATQANLYLRQGEAPTTGSYTARVTSANAATKTITRTNPAAANWYVGLIGRSTAGFSGVTVRVTYQLNTDGCSGGGWVNCVGATPTGRTDAGEMQNFATWFSYHRTRMKVAKAGAGRAFAEIGSNYRVGYRNIWNNMPESGNIPGGGRWNTHPITRNKPIPVTRNNGLFDDPNTSTGADNNRTAWYQRLYAQTSSGATPLRKALWDSGNYFATDVSNTGPWGPEATVDQYACRQNFTILTTDGYRNDDTTNSADFDYTGLNSQVGEQDNAAGTTITSPSGVTFAYSPAAPFASTYSNTLADIAMHYWKTDLRTDLLNVVQPSAANPAFWQHMSTFSISIGAAGTLNPATDLPNMTAGAAWPEPRNLQATSIDDLWHATVNGRGTFNVATDPDSFSTALRDALADIAKRTGSFSNVASNTTSLDADTRIFQASYLSGVWSGQLSAFPVSETSVNGVTVRAISANPSWQASAGVPPLASRKVFSFNGSAVVPFPSGATSAQLTALGRTLDYPVTGEDNAAYIAGSRDLEIGQSGGTLRARAHLLGDIVGSSPAYSEDSDAVYVGANDGMLHAISAETGAELFAYIPGIVNWARLREISSPEYLHRYFVDGPIIVSDRKQTPGKNILVGALGKGGKGLFALDVSTPESFGSGSELWERSETPGGNMGFVQGAPVIAELPNGSGGSFTALIVGNGVNSTHDRAVLLIYDLATGNLVREIGTGSGSLAEPNGLSAPVGWDSNGDGVVDVVYAGDMLGNVWRFNTSGASSGWAATRIFTTVAGQPVTGRITVAMHPANFSTWIFFGTGRFMTGGDLTDVTTQALYGIRDDGDAVERDQLIERQMVVAGTRNGQSVRSFQKYAPLPLQTADDVPLTVSGWYLNLLDPPSHTQAGERIVTEAQVVNRVLTVASVIPTAEACQPDGRGYINALDAFSGTSLKDGSFFDLDGDGDFGDETLDTDDGPLPIGSVDLGVGMPTLPSLLRELAVVGGSSGGAGSVRIRDNRASGRVSWREVVME